MANMLVDAMICALAQVCGMEAPEAYGRLLRAKTVTKINSQWRFAKGAYQMDPSPENVVRFVQDTYNIPLELPADMNGSRISQAHLNIVFEGVAKILIGRGDVEMG